MIYILYIACFCSCGGLSDSTQSLGNEMYFIFEGGDMNQLIVGYEDDIGVTIEATLLSGVKQIAKEDSFVYAQANGIIDTSSVMSYISRYNKPAHLFRYELNNEGQWCGSCWFVVDAKTKNLYGPLSQSTFSTLSD